MLNTNYLVYFEVKTYDGEDTYYSGGLLHANDWGDAADQLRDYYGDELMSMTIELYDSDIIAFDVSVAREIKTIIDKYN